MLMFVFKVPGKNGMMQPVAANALNDHDKERGANELGHDGDM